MWSPISSHWRMSRDTYNERNQDAMEQSKTGARAKWFQVSSPCLLLTGVCAS